MGTAVAALKNPERFVGLLTLFARPGVRESLRDVDCLSAVDDALQWMLKHYLNGQFTAEVSDAWRAAYVHVGDVVVENGLIVATDPIYAAISRH